MPEPAVPAAPAGGARDVAVVVPCYDEGRRLPVAAFRAFAEAHPTFAFLFVDDGSRDDTKAVLEAMQAERPAAFRVLGLPRNSGKGEAVRRGMTLAAAQGARFLAYWDADLATPLDVLPAFRAVFEERPAVEVVLGSRVKLLGREIDRRPLRHYLGRVFATAASATLRLGVYDTQCGAKMFRATDTVRAIFAEPFTSRWIFDVELLARFLKRRRDEPGRPAAEACLYELPLPVWKDVAGSKVRPLDFFVSFVELLRIRHRYRP
jgi:glycosyltransferase involved in cell wall biosynthesis